MNLIDHVLEKPLLADANNNRTPVGATNALVPPGDKDRKKERRHRSRRNRDKERRELEAARALQTNGERLANLDISKESRNRRDGSNELEVLFPNLKQKLFV